MDSPSSKIAVNAVNIGNRMFISTINNEGNYHIKIGTVAGGLNKNAMKFIG